jgi:hypothetical protein
MSAESIASAILDPVRSKRAGDFANRRVAIKLGVLREDFADDSDHVIAVEVSYRNCGRLVGIGRLVVGGTPYFASGFALLVARSRYSKGGDADDSRPLSSSSNDATR